MTDKEPISSQLYPTKQNIIKQMNELLNFANSIPTDQTVQLFLLIPDTDLILGIHQVMKLMVKMRSFVLLIIPKWLYC